MFNKIKMDKRLKYLMGWFLITGLLFKICSLSGADLMFLTGTISLFVYYMYKVIKGLVLKSSKILILKYVIGFGFGLGFSMYAMELNGGYFIIVCSWGFCSLYCLYRLIKG